MAEISQGRKTAYYAGNALAVLGFIIFFSVFVTGVFNFGDFSNFEAEARSAGIRGVLGMALIIVGGFVRSIGAQGLAGSGVVLDPEQAREDLKPYSHQAGRMLNDVLEKAEPTKHLGVGAAPERVVMLKCRECSFLNEEDSKFCQECGTRM